MLHLHQMSWTEFIYFWKLLEAFGSFLEAFGKWRENLNLNLELKLICIKFELNLKVGCLGGLASPGVPAIVKWNTSVYQHWLFWHLFGYFVKRLLIPLRTEIKLQGLKESHYIYCLQCWGNKKHKLIIHTLHTIAWSFFWVYFSIRLNDIVVSRSCRTYSWSIGGSGVITSFNKFSLRNSLKKSTYWRIELGLISLCFNVIY